MRTLTGGVVTPAEANRTALIAITRVLQAAEPIEIDVAGTAVRVEVQHEDTSWPMSVPGLDEVEDGPWPRQVRLRCRWDGGNTELLLQARAARRPEAKVSVAVHVVPSRRQLTWSTVAKALVGSDDPEVAVSAWFHLKKRTGGSGVAQRRKNAHLKELVTASELPLLTASSVELFTIRTEDGGVLPSPSEAYRRLLHVSLIKLDFFSRGQEAKLRGNPLIDISALDDDDASEDDVEDTDERRFWAGGFGERDRLEQFVAGHYWSLGWQRDAETRGAQVAWKYFDGIQVGDWFAIKGFGGSNQLTVHYVGEVTGKDDIEGRLELRQLPNHEHYKGPAPGGAGAGSWFGTLVPVTRADVIHLIFGLGEPGSLAWTGPTNLILYGPPGTGKTYRLRDEIFPKFTRESGARELDVDQLVELSWFQVIAAALAEAGGQANARALSDHDFVRAKYRAKDHKAPIGSRVWATLQSHTVESSTTVNYSRRSGRLVFDKRDDGVWFFSTGVPEDIADLAGSLTPRAADVSEDFVFVTFHQSYAYEDFIEGIRPKTLGAEDDSGPSLTYDLEDGVFLRAANAAVRLAGFDGTVDELCRRPAEERRNLFEEARPYGVFVDEISRGNVSRIFGELITLLEEDKRLGGEGELIVTLPYSRRRFGVPPNLCLIGTMNTADRSVEALDTALRRRFAFWECAPDPSVLDGVLVEGVVDVPRLLRTINGRLEVLLDRDHLIGHAHFMRLVEDPTIEVLKDVFATSILPLLAEYFYADLGRVGLVLGGRFVRRRSSRAALAPFDHEATDQLSERVTYRLTRIHDLSTADFRSIYAAEE